MLHNYFKLALRNISKHKTSTIINIFGLIVGITCCIVIFAKVKYEGSFDTFHSESDRIYRIVRITSGLEYLKGKPEYRAGIFPAFPHAIREEIPEVEKVAIVSYMHGATFGVPVNNDLNNLQLFNEKEGVTILEPEFFEIFDFSEAPLEWYYGDPESSLGQPFTVVLTRKMADKYFKGQDVLGQTLVMNGETKLRVKGIISDFPTNTNFPFNVLVSYATLTELYKGIQNNWGGLNDFHQCFIKLADQTSPGVIEEKLKQIHGEHRDNYMIDERLFKLQPLRNMHFDEDFRGHNFNKSIFPHQVKITLLAIAIFLILIVCINYNNLSIAISSSRNREIAIRKVMGSKIKNLIAQFIGESLIITTLSMVIAIIVATHLMQRYHDFFGLPHMFRIQPSGQNLAFMVGFLLIISLISGAFPSLLFAKLKPVTVFEKKNWGLFNKGLRFNRSSVMLQFIVTQIMLICTIIIFKQLYFINTTDLGFHRAGILTVRLPNNHSNERKIFEHQMNQVPSIKQVSFSSSSAAVSNSYGEVRYSHNGIENEIDVEWKYTDENFITTYGLELLYGRNFSRTDSSFNIIVNEEFFRELEFTDISEGIGKVVRIQGDDATVIGIVKDCHSNSLYAHIRPSVFINNSRGFWLAGINYHVLESKNGATFNYLRDLISEVESSWKSVYQGNSVFQYEFMEDTLDRYYRDEIRFSRTVNLFTMLMVFISCLGIIGFSFYSIKKKTREIAIRKVNGARSQNVITIFASGYFTMILVSVIIAAPVAYYAMNRWLEHFAYKTEISWWIFALSGLLTLLITLITISMQSWKAAGRNPVEALRYE